jgi:hypothetical protein
VLVDRRLLPAAAAAIGAAVGIRTLLEWWIVASPVYPFDNLKDFHVVLDSMSARYASRRLLLTTAGTWNLLLPLMAVGMASRRWGGRELALSGALAVTMIQLLFATDNERVVAAGYPFVLAWSVFALDAINERERRWAGAAIGLAQLPWLLEMGRVWPAPLPEGHLPQMPPIRFVEIAIVAAAVIAAGVALSRRLAVRTAAA